MVMFDRQAMTDDEIVAATYAKIAPIRKELEAYTKEAARIAEKRGEFMPQDIAAMDALALRIADWIHTGARSMYATVKDGVTYQQALTVREHDEFLWKLEKYERQGGGDERPA